MKSAWNIFSFLAVTHLLALLMFVGWLWQSNRLNTERITTVRELFALTIEQAEQAAIEASEAELALRQDALDEQRRVAPPLSSAARIASMTRMEEIEQRTLRRIEQEKSMMREQLTDAQRAIEQREAELEAARSQWLASIEAERERRADEQFAKTVRQYESLRPRQGKEMLVELIADGQMEQAVAYLDAMNARAASRILGEFKTEPEIQLATELLEQLRKFGLPAVDPQETGNAQNLADAR